MAGLLRRHRNPRAHSAGQHHRFLAHRATGLLRHRRISHEPTEAINLLIKKVKRVAHGFRTSTTTGSACYCIVASTGTLSQPRRSEAGYHAQRRRAP